MKCKIFCDISKPGLEAEINYWLNNKDIDIINIVSSTSNRKYTNVIIFYKEKV